MITTNIALYGRTGSGKSTVARYLASQYGYAHRMTGSACRQVCQILYSSESKTLLNQVTDVLKTLDENIWLRAALVDAPFNNPIVFDSMRFRNDYLYLKSRGFHTWRIEAPLDVRVERLRARGQTYDASVDELHSGETELDNYEFDYQILNAGSDITSLYQLVDHTISEMAPAEVVML